MWLGSCQPMQHWLMVLLSVLAGVLTGEKNRPDFALGQETGANDSRPKGTVNR
jgi:hypothetical protein